MIRGLAGRFKGWNERVAKRQERLPIPHPRYKDRNFEQGGRSFYFFDFDDNIVFLTTPIYLFHRKTGEELSLPSGDYAHVRPLIGSSGPYAEFEVIHDDQSGTFRNFRDRDLSWIHRLRGERQPFLEEIESLLARPDLEWKGPSWDCFFHAVYNQRPISVITARGHNPDTIKRGLKQLVDMGHLVREPNYLSLYPVTYPDIQRKIGHGLSPSDVPGLKRRAIRASVELALKTYGEDKPHRFGMSDDDPNNLELVTEEMAALKSEFPHLSFFVIESRPEYCVKREVGAQGLLKASEGRFKSRQLPLFK